MRLWLLALAACTGQGGTLNVTLVTAPGSHVLDSAQQLKLVVTNPHKVTTASRGPNGFSLEVDLPADGTLGALIVDAYDASGALVATGASPPFQSGGLEAKIVIYMAAPNTIGAAPLTLPTALADLGAASLGYGVVFAGGTGTAGVSDFTAIYNAFDHSLVQGMALPAPRSALAVGVGANGAVYLFGGNDSSGMPTDNLWRFDTTVAPNGSYTDDGAKDGFARADQVAVPLGGDEFVVTGTPPAQLAGLQGTITMLPGIAALPNQGTSLTATDGVATAFFTGASGVVRFRNPTFDMPAAPATAGSGITALPGGKVLVACGAPDAVRIDAASNAVDPVAGVPGVAKSGCAIAATTRHVLLAGGTLASGGVDPSALILDATTLAPIGTVPLVVPRTGAVALALPNDQILIVGGLDGSGAPIDTIELFTPMSAE
jgi:hypothetical protein